MIDELTQQITELRAERDKYKADADRQNITIVNLTDDLLYIAGIVEIGTGKPLNKNVSVTKQVLDYVKSKEAEADRLAELLAWAMTYVDGESDRFGLIPSEQKVHDIARAALAAHEEGKNG
jgi:hypothetical protein